MVSSKTVTAKQIPPNLVWLIDRSAAMAQPATSHGFRVSRLEDVQAVLQDELVRAHRVAKQGFSVFPGDSECGAAQVLLPVGAQAEQIDGWLQAVTPVGQAPIAASLAAMTGLDSPRVEDFVLLLTGSEPGCGGDALEEVKALRRRGIRTIVVGYGQQVARSAALDALARAGGFARGCPGGPTPDCACGADAICSPAYASAGDARALHAVFGELFQSLEGDRLCQFTLEVMPRSVDRVAVMVDGVLYERGADSWTLDPPQIVFHGSLCTRLKESTTDHPVTVELRVDVRP
ncbi:MAG: hypothetical protein IPJ65_27850 [Archangiaceae bacterium]|nr:hypothetical protein [Archangiaceae bacterium]